MIDLRSDTVTKPSREMRAAMAAAEVGDDVYGEDPTVNRLEERAAEICGKQAALFVPTGTMGNTIAIKLHTKHGEEVLCEARSHVMDWELAMMGLPQRDLAECLVFMLPERASREEISRRLEQHRAALERDAGIEIRRDEWEHGFRAALCDFLVDRLASYAMVDRVRRQAFLPRVARGWLNLYQHYPFA